MTKHGVLKAFYRAYVEWLNAGAPEDNRWGFTRNLGLCSQVVNVHVEDDVSFDEWDVLRLMQQQFNDAGLDKSLPFNDDFHLDYYLEKKTRTIHLNPKRIAWVREHAA